MKQKHFTIKMYSKETGISETTLRRLCKTRKITNSKKIGGRWHILVPIENEVKQSSNERNKALIVALEHVVESYNEVIDVLKNNLNCS